MPGLGAAVNVLGELAPEVTGLCAERRCRPVLIRRHGRQDRKAPRRWGLVDARPGHESVRWGQLSADQHLLDVITADEPGVPGREPAYLVCAHGRHDACCAVRGRPVAAALAAAYPDRTWECSHVGGDRFAANLVVLPHGLYYGHVTPADVSGLVTAYEAGLVEPRLLRGRSSLPPAVQAAQHHARLKLGSTGVDALPPLRVEPAGPATWQVLLDHPAGPVTVTVRAERGPPVRLTCLYRGRRRPGCSGWSSCCCRVATPTGVTPADTFCDATMSIGAPRRCHPRTCRQTARHRRGGGTDRAQDHQGQEPGRVPAHVHPRHRRGGRAGLGRRRVNGWTPGRHELKPLRNGTRWVSVRVPADRPVRFRYLAANGTWFDDPDVADRDGPDCLITL